MFSRRIFLAALLAAVSWVGAARTCDFCFADKGPTIAASFSQARAVMLVRVEKDPVFDSTTGKDHTDLIIDRVVKDYNDFLKNKKNLRVDNAIAKSKTQVLLFCDIWKDRPGVFRKVELAANSDMIKYVEGAVALKDKPVGERLRYHFDFLDSPERDIAVDAYREFAIADYQDYRKMAKELPADRIAGWLNDPRTSPFRYGLYSSLLGHCGNAEHAKLLRKKIDHAIKTKGSETYGLLAGYVMLDPKEAWSFITNLLRDDKEDFFTRYSCLQTAAFLRDQRPDLVTSKDLNSGVAQVLEFPDIADQGIEYLRKGKAWDWTGQVLDLSGKKNADNDLIKRAILRFALSSTDPRAATFVKEMRQRNAEYVADIEEVLKQGRD